MRDLRLACIGCGSIMETHLEVIRGHVHDVKLAALCDVNEENLRKLGEKHEIESLYLDYRDLLEKEDIDAVDIAVRPEEEKPEIVKASARAGKHIFLEKPMAVTVKDAEEMGSVIEQNKVKFQLGFHRRFLVEFRKAREITATPEFGGVAALLVSHAASGFPLVSFLAQVPHTLDLVLFLGGPVQSISGHCYKVKAHSEAEFAAAMRMLPEKDRTYARNEEMIIDLSVVASLRFENGAVGSFVFSSFGAGNVPQRVEVFGRNHGVVTVELGRGGRFYSSRRPDGESWGASSGMDGYIGEFQQFADYVLRDAVPLVGLSEGLQGVRLYEAILTSTRDAGEGKVC